MKASVDIPQPLPVTDCLTVMCINASQAFVTIHGDGTVTYRGNGGGAPEYTLDLVALGEAIQRNTRAPVPEAVILAARHLDESEGPLGNPGHALDRADRAAIRTVIRYIAEGLNR